MKTSELARDTGAITRDGAASSHRFALRSVGMALGVVVSLVAVVGCGDSERGDVPESQSGGLSPASEGSSSPGDSGQGGASASEPGAGGASGASATGGTESSLPTDLPLGVGGAGGGMSGALDGVDAGDGGAGAPSATEAPVSPVEPGVFAPCPTDGSACRIMPLGDSITDGLVGNAPGNTAQSAGGYRVELLRQARADGREITFVGRNQNGPDAVDGQPFPRNHEGYSGATISTGMNQLASRVAAALAANPPHIVLLHIGTNNLYQGMPPELPEQLESVLDQLSAGAPDALVVVAQITPLSPTTFPNNGVDQYNALMPGIVRERNDAGQHLLLIDANGAFRAASADVGALVGDGIHPNGTGYGVLAQAWYAGLRDVLP